MSVVLGSVVVSPRLEIDGEVILCTDVVTMRGLESIATCLGAPYTVPRAWMPFIAIGQGETSPSTEDVVLETEIFRKRADTIWAEGIAYKAQVDFVAGEPEEDFTLREIGLLSEVAGGILGVRWSPVSDIAFTSADIWRFTCIVVISNI